MYNYLTSHWNWELDVKFHDFHRVDDFVMLGLRISSLRRQWHFHFARAFPLENLQETFEEAPRPRPGATDAKASVLFQNW